MSKTKGNFFTFRDLQKQGFSATAIRYLLLSVPYDKQLNFTFEGLQGAAITVERLRQFRRLVREAVTEAGSNLEVKTIVNKSLHDFETALDDNLNTSMALAAIHNLVREINIVLAKNALLAAEQNAVSEAIAKFDAVLGIFGQETVEMLDAENRKPDRRTPRIPPPTQFCPLRRNPRFTCRKRNYPRRHERRRKMETEVSRPRLNAEKIAE